MRWYRARSTTRHRLAAAPDHAPHTYYVRRESATSSRVYAWYVWHGWLCWACLNPEEARAHLEIVGEAADQQHAEHMNARAMRHDNHRRTPEVIRAEETVCTRCQGKGTLRVRRKWHRCYSCQGTGRTAAHGFDQSRDMSLDQRAEYEFDQRATTTRTPRSTARTPAPELELEPELELDPEFAQEARDDWEDAYFNQDPGEAHR